MTARLAVRYLAVFAVVLLALSIGAYQFVAREYASLLLPALGTPEGALAYSAAMRRVAWTILAFDVPLLLLVGAASWLLARASLEPLIAARERERAFAADAAHALRSPLATIASVAQAARTGTSPEIDDSLETITGAALDASATVGDLLTLAREADIRSLSREPIDLAAVVAATAKEFRTRAAALSLAIESDPQSAIVDGDERRLRELARNLVDNAVRHARSRISISSRVADDRAEIVVSNDGGAIAPELREKIFERFYQVSPNGAGAGLGLAIVRWIAQAHGGEAFVREGGENRAELVVRLPLLAQET